MREADRWHRILIHVIASAIHHMRATSWVWNNNSHVWTSGLRWKVMTGVFIPSQPSMRTVGNFQCQSTNRLQKGVDGCQFSARTPSQTKRKNRNHYQPSRQPSYARGYAYTSAESGTGKWYIAVHFRVSIDRQGKTLYSGNQRSSTSSWAT